MIEHIANLVGVQRVTDDIGRYVWEAIKKYKKLHKIAEIDDRLILVKEKIADCPSCGQKLRFPDKDLEFKCPKCKSTFRNC